MKYRFFAIPVRNPSEAEEEMNRFLSGHRIVAIEKQLVTSGAEACWAFCVEWVEQEGVLKPSAPGVGNRVDYKEVLNEKDFTVFAELRNIRKEMAEREGIPPYAVFTNEQLADIVRKRISTPSELQGLKGIGATKVEKYGKIILEEAQRLLVTEKQ